MKAKADINLIQNSREKYHVVFFPYPSFFFLCLYPKIVFAEGAWIFLSVLLMKCPFILYVIFWLFRILFNILAIRIVTEFGMDVYTLLYLKWIINKDPHGTLLSVMWQPRWEGSLGEIGYMHMYGWVALLCIWSYHNVINWLYSNIK